MSLTSKVTSIVILVFLLSGLSSLAIQHFVVMPSFLALEKEVANRNVERALEAINGELDQISPSVIDWSNWTDTYNFVKGELPEYTETQLDNSEKLTTVEGMRMNFLGMYDMSGKALWNAGLNRKTGKRANLGALSESSLATDHPLFAHTGLTSEVRGIIRTTLGPMLIVAKPILTSERKGPAVGTLAMGRLLNAAFVGRLADQTKLPLSVSAADTSQHADWIGDAPGHLARTATRFTETPDAWRAETTFSDLFGKPVLKLRVDTARDISARGSAAISMSMWSLSAVALLTLTVLWLLLRRAVLRPLSQLTDHALRIGADDHLQTHLDLKRQDELGVLATTYNDMLDRLAEARRRLVAQSFRSGVAEMASGVLHNIGNAVTPLKVKLCTLARDLGEAPVAEMELAAAELNDPATDPDRRKDLARFVELAGIELADLVKRSRDEVALASQQVVHVQEILSDQERFSRSARVIEPVNIGAVIRECANSLSPHMKKAMQIEVSPEVSKIGLVAGARAALQQVITNLLVNAAEAVLEAGARPGRVEVRASREALQGRAMAHLRFTDNGVGIEPDHLRHLFERGFSTKKRHGSGHGLHWSANTVSALGGRLSAESIGAGRGACLHLWLPLAESLVEKATGTDG